MSGKNLQRVEQPFMEKDHRGIVIELGVPKELNEKERIIKALAKVVAKSGSKL